MCRVSAYENCHEETKNDDCLFHKPNKDENESKEFYREFIKRFKPKISDICPINLLKERKVDIKRLGFDIKVDLLKKKALIFEEEVNCRGYVFPEVPSDIEEGFFEFAIFKDSARFDWAIFKGKAWFICATFEKDVGFRYTTFETGTRFNGCSFKGKVSFAGSKFKLIRGLDESIFDLPDSEAEALRIQRMCYEEEGRKEDADNTFVKERRALRRARVYNAKKKSVILFTISSISSIIEYFLADLTCKYGTDWIRPVILWVFSVFFLFPLL